MADGSAAVLHRLASGSESLIGSQCRIGCYKSDIPYSDLKLLCRDLSEGSANSLTELHLAGVHLDAAVGFDADPCIEELVFLQTTWKLCFFVRLRWLLAERL